ncbi:hypothetical protein F0562_019160 [Nyssa sinensis]|uniref:Uncharacterized protein n=1 Tax=Nyssa sinensis TaxID=561372 RepID=A0A5J4ZF64_9ASTE|nr:hypothetical protein F0562_019160 [Nyssa sinensis]
MGRVYSNFQQEVVFNLNHASAHPTARSLPFSQDHLHCHNPPQPPSIAILLCISILVAVSHGFHPTVLASIATQLSQSPIRQPLQFPIRQPVASSSSNKNASGSRLGGICMLSDLNRLFRDGKSKREEDES